jgi:hypothetical protein
MAVGSVKKEHRSNLAKLESARFLLPRIGPPVDGGHLTMNKSSSAAGWFLLGVVATLVVVAVVQSRPGPAPVVVKETCWQRLLKHPLTQTALSFVAQVVASLIRPLPAFRFG